MDKGRSSYIDIVKGLGVVAVLCVHAGIIGNVGIYITPYYMPLFLVLSGIGFSLKTRDNDYAINSFKRIALNYFKYAICVFIIALPWIFITHMENSKILLNVFGICYGRKALYYPLSKSNNITWMDFGNGPMWFLPWLATSWLFFGLIVRQNSKKKTYFTIILLIAITKFLQYFPILLPWSLDTAPIGGVFIYAGTRYKKVDILAHLGTKIFSEKMIPLIKWGGDTAWMVRL